MTISLPQHKNIVEGVEVLVAAGTHVFEFKTQSESDAFMERCRTVNPS